MPNLINHPFWCKNALVKAGGLLSLYLFLLMTTTPAAWSQQFRNEWIDYNKTYYRFPVIPAVSMPTSTGLPPASNHDNLADYNMLHRIPYATLQAAGLGNVPVEHLQFWRNGEEVAVFTSPATGVMDNNGFIEFWGEHNDGKPDKDLYRQGQFQTNSRWSLFSDTAFYYITVNTNGPNKRIIPAANNALSSNLVPDSFFMHRITISPRTHRNLGFALNISNTEIRSSSFDAGEGFATRRTAAAMFTIPLNNLFVKTNTDSAMRISYWAQSASNSNNFMELRLNDSILGVRQLRRYASDSAFYTGVPMSRITANATTIGFRPPTLSASYQFFVSKVELVYPRSFEFQKTNTSFVFTLAPNETGNLLKIVNFDNSVHQKILIDRSNNKRYEAIAVADTLWFALEGSTIERNLVLTTVNAANAALVRSVPALTPRNFVDYSSVQNQGDYLIISHQSLYNDNGTNHVEAYRAYRSSAAGGNYTARNFEIGELIEQFAHNIEKHPLAIRNLLRYARANYATQPKAAFIIGRGASYEYNIGNTTAPLLNLVPTWGHPASDNLLAAADNENIAPATPIGRLAAITGAEVKDYLDKVKAFEALQNNPLAENGWQKTTLHLIGSNDASIVEPLKAYMSGWEKTISDTLVGARVATYSRNDPNTAINNQKIINSIKSGAGLVSYFGHSSATSLDFNLNEPKELEITPGRFPVYIANGCKAAECFDLNTLRFNQNRLTLTEKFVLSKNSGSIAFLASTTFGILQYLDDFSKQWYLAMSTSRYGKSIGAIQQEGIRQMMLQTTDIASRLTAEQFLLHGDPAIRIHTQDKPDYAIDSNQIVIRSLPLSVANDSVRFSFKLTNEGQALRDTFIVKVSRQLPGGISQPMAQYQVINLRSDSLFTGSFAIRGHSDAGLNQIKIEVDAFDETAEFNETNNVATKHFFVQPKGLTPMVPADLSIVNTWPVPLVASTFNSNLDSGLYRLEMDTTMQFNSPLLVHQEVTGKNGAVRFNPGNGLLEGKVYYWRTTQVVSNTAGEWRTASFTYLPGETPGFNQGHYFQHLQSAFQRIQIDSLSRRFEFTPRLNNIYTSHGIFPTSGTEDGHFSVTPNGITSIASACIGRSIIFNVFDSLSFIPWRNPGGGIYGSANVCKPPTQYNFEFNYFPASNRKRMMDFLDIIPKGHFVVARLVVDPPTDSMQVQYWKRDTAIYGSGQSIYHKLFNQGFYDLDSLNRTRTFAFIFKKDDTVSFKPRWVFSDGVFDRPVGNFDIPMIDTSGIIKSPWIGPAQQWNAIKWKGLDDYVEENGLVTDTIRTAVIGRLANGNTDTLFKFNSQIGNVSLQAPFAIDAAKYRYIQLVQTSADSDNATPFPLDYWRVNYSPVPEGALAPADYFHFTTNRANGLLKDTLEVGRDTLQFGIAFRNIGETAFTDSLYASIYLEDSAGNKTLLHSLKIKPLDVNDTAVLYTEAPLTTAMLGSQFIYAQVNQNGAIAEVSYLNNQLYRSFYVKASTVAANTKIFNGTGLWSEANKWLPVGVPACTDKVIINGNCEVDVNNAVSDSLWVSGTGTLRLVQAGAGLNIGCAQNGGNKLATVSGALIISAGTLQVNGGLLFVSGSQFTQSGGEIFLDPNNDDSATSLQLSSLAQANTPQPLATLSFGGMNTTPPAQPNGPYTAGQVQLTGGTITLVDAPHDSTALSIYLGNTVGSQLVIDSAHHLVVGSNNEMAVSLVSTNAFKILIAGDGSTQLPALGSMTITSPMVPNRAVKIIKHLQPYILTFRGKLVLQPHAILILDTSIELTFEKQ